MPLHPYRNEDADAATSALPLISVIVPTYNRCDSLKMTLDGFASQSYPPHRFEVIVVSDGSTDGTDEILAEYAERATYTLRPLRQQNGGPARARNHGIREAIGEIVVFTDDDVEPAPHFLSAHAAHHQKDDAVAVIGPLSRDPKRHRLEAPWVAWEHAMLEKQYVAFETGVWKNAGPHHFYSGNASLRREHLVAVGGFDETFGRQEDVELAVRLERDRNLRFCFDANAAATHRPLRSFASWMKVPHAYGHLDVVRAQRGDTNWETVRHGYVARHAATRLLSDLTITAPFLNRPLHQLLKTCADISYRCKVEKGAFAFLSALYNMRYLEGAREELGSGIALRRVLQNSSLPSLPVSSAE